MFAAHVLPIAVVLTSIVAPSGFDPRPPDAGVPVREQKALSSFLRAVDDYVVVYRVIEPLEPDALCLPDGGYGSVTDLRSRTLDERSLKEGAIFDAEVANLFRQRLAATVRLYGSAPLDLVSTMNREELTAPFVTVGKPLPWGVGSPALTWLFVALPVLPEELDYRLVARDLVLLDVHANVVVDVLRDALPMY
jgi:hypothetical protein